MDEFKLGELKLFTAFNNDRERRVRGVDRNLARTKVNIKRNMARSRANSMDQLERMEGDLYALLN